MGTSAPSGTTATVSPPAQQAERPPRLATAINNVIVDPDRTTDGSDTLPAGEALTAPRLTEIMEWIAKLLDDDAAWAKVWEAEGGIHPHPEQLDATGLAEEAWAKGMDELFLGTAYGGSSIIANVSNAYIFERFAATSDDPAYSLFVACQQLSTYGALGRGLSFTDDLNDNGMAANQSTSQLKVFTSGKGQWYTTGPTGAAAPAQPGAPAPAAPAKSISSAQAFDADAVVQAAPGFGGGTVYTYNPVGHVDKVETGAWFGDVYVDKDGHFVVNPKVAQQTVLAAQNAVTEANRAAKAAADAASSMLPFGMKIEPPTVDVGHGVIDILQKTPGIGDALTGQVPAILPIRVQLEGSHISMVLRKYKTNTGLNAVQMLDTTGHGMPPGINGSTESTLRDYPMFAPLTYAGIYCGEAYGNDGPGTRAIPSGTGSFVGLGTLPPLADAGTIESHLKRARPVGVARLVIIDTRANPKEPTIDDVVFISRAILMWSKATPTRNYTISRLLFSLRNTPHRKALKAYWVVYAPRNKLSAAMWNDGARAMPLEIMEGAWDRVYEVAMCAAILGHDDDGRAQEIWRNRTGNSNGSPPRILRSLFVDTWGPSKEWFDKQIASLTKQYNAEYAKRRAEKDALIAEIGRLNPAAQKGDEAARRRIEEAKTRIKEIDALPPPEAVLVAKAFAANPFLDDFQPLPMRVRSYLLSTYSAPFLGSVSVPGRLSGAAP